MYPRKKILPKYISNYQISNIIFHIFVKILLDNTVYFSVINIVVTGFQLKAAHV